MLRLRPQKSLGFSEVVATLRPPGGDQPPLVLVLVVALVLAPFSLASFHHSNPPSFPLRPIRCHPRPSLTNPRSFFFPCPFPTLTRRFSFLICPPQTTDLYGCK